MCASTIYLLIDKLLLLSCRDLRIVKQCHDPMNTVIEAIFWNTVASLDLILIKPINNTQL